MRQSTCLHVAGAALGLALSVATPIAARAQSSSTPDVKILDSATVQLLGYHARIPVGWVPRAASSTMRLAEFIVPSTNAASGADGAEVIVYFFGKGQGGNVAANLARWKAQFSTPDGSPVLQTITRDSSGAFPITFAEYRGTYARGIGAGSAPEDAKPGQELLAGITETPRGTLFFQLFGPAARVVAEREIFMKFVRGLHD